MIDPGMHEDIKEIKGILQNLDSKLDKYAEETHANTIDIKWIKGFAKTSLTIIVAFVTAAIGYIFPTR